MAGVVIVDLIPNLAWLCLSIRQGLALTWVALATWEAAVLVNDGGGGKKEPMNRLWLNHLPDLATSGPHCPRVTHLMQTDCKVRAQ